MKKALCKVIIVVLILTTLLTVLCSCSNEAKIDRLLEKAANEEATAGILLRKGQVGAASQAMSKADSYRNQADALKTRLDTPQNVKITNGILSWNPVDGASYYFINYSYYGDTIFADLQADESSQDTSFKLPFKDGAGYSVAVRAATTSRYHKQSNYSQIMNYIPERVVVTINNGGVIKDETKYLEPINDGVSFVSDWYYNETGKSIIGYFYDAELTQPYQKSSLASDITLYSKWVDYKVALGTSIQNGTMLKGDVIIDEGIKRIEKEAFKGNKDITSVTLPQSLIYVGDSAFASCDNLKYVDILNPNIEIGKYYPFGNATVYCASEEPIKENNKLGSIIWNYSGERGITDDGIEWARRNDDTVIITKYSGDGEILFIPSTINGLPVKEIAAAKSDVIKSVYISGSIINIGTGAFCGCKDLTSVYIENGVENIGAHVFSMCYALTEVFIPSSVEIIGDYAFTLNTDIRRKRIYYCSSPSRPDGWGDFEKYQIQVTFKWNIADVNSSVKGFEWLDGIKR